MAIRKRYELVIEGRSVLRLRPKQDKVVLKYDAAGYGNYTNVIMDREHVLELRDTLDEILMSWFCPPEEHRICPVCEDMLTSKKAEPLVFSPADVGRLDMGEPVSLSPEQIEVGRAAARRLAEKMRPERLVGRESGQVMQGNERPIGLGDEDEMEEARRTC